MKESSRRRFLETLGVGVAGVAGVSAVGCGPETRETPPAPERPRDPPDPPERTSERTPSEPELPSGLARADFIVHGTQPWTLETRRERIGTSLVTATKHLFVRNNLAMPNEFSSRDAWELEVEGTTRPATLRLADLKRLGLSTTAMVLQCSGNGRRFYEHGPSGSQWGVGAAGCVLVSGVPLRDVIEHLGGAVAGANYVTATGGDPLPPDVERETVVVERSIPISKALDHAILGWEMNGEALPHVHGGPLRLFVPGFFGCNQIKWLKRLELTSEQTSAKIMRSGYRMRPVGESGAPDQESMWAMPVKSWIVRPATLPIVQGRVQVAGVAFAGDTEVEKVEWSSDGERWHPARLVGPNLGPFAWRTFAFDVESTPGTLTLFTRATDRNGQVQPERRVENERGYGNTSWRDMGVVVRVCGPDDDVCLRPPEDVERRRTGPVELSEAGRRGQVLFATVQPACGTCHALEHAAATGEVGPSLDELGGTQELIEAAIRNGVGAMPAFGEQLSESELRDLATYVFEATH